MDILAEYIPSKDNLVILRLKGELDSNSVAEFENELSVILGDGSRDILVDMTDLEFMSSAGVRALNTLYHQLHPTGSAEEKKAVSLGIRAGTYEAPHLKLLAPSDRILHVLKMSGLDMYLCVYDDEGEAIAAF
jgi:ABC-type transporter Mla MlaB component